MQDSIYTVLKSKLDGVEIEIDGEKKPAIDFVSYLDEGVSKTRAANADLTKQREQWEAERKANKQQLTELANLKSTLEAQVEELSGKTKRKSSESDELQRNVNALTEQISQLTKKYEEAEARSMKEAAARKESQQLAFEERTKAEIIAELGRQRIVGNQADVAYSGILTKKLVKIVEDAEKGFVPVYVTQKDGKELSATLSSMCKAFAEDNPFLISASGTRGTGDNHDTKSKEGTGKRPSAFDMLAMKD